MQSPDENEWTVAASKRTKTVVAAAPKRTRTRGGRRRRRDKKELPQSCKVQGMLFGDLDPIPFNARLDSPPGACLNCRSRKHKHKDCLEPKTHEYCCNCGRRGFTVDECPRCERAFRAQNDTMKKWIYWRFFDGEGDGCEQTTERGDEMWEYGEKQTVLNESRGDEKDRRGPSADDEYGEDAGVREKLDVEPDDSEPPEPYYSRETEPNLDETTTADVDSLGENTVVFVDDAPKKDEDPLRSDGDPLQDYLLLLGALKNLSVEAQNGIVLQFLSERKKQMAEKEAEFGNSWKSP